MSTTKIIHGADDIPALSESWNDYTDSRKAERIYQAGTKRLGITAQELLRRLRTHPDGEVVVLGRRDMNAAKKLHSLGCATLEITNDSKLSPTGFLRRG